eukprot:1136361-Rhodomonas_salina.3
MQLKRHPRSHVEVDVANYFVLVPALWSFSISTKHNALPSNEIQHKEVRTWRSSPSSHLMWRSREDLPEQP